MVVAVILEASSIAVALAAGCEYWRSRRGPLVLLALVVTHARAFCLCLRRELARVPERWRQQYPLAVCEVKRQG